MLIDDRSETCHLIMLIEIFAAEIHKAQTLM